MIRGVDAHRLVGAAVHIEIGLAIAREILLRKVDASSDRTFVNAARPRLAVGVVRRAADVERDQTRVSCARRFYARRGRVRLKADRDYPIRSYAPRTPSDPGNTRSACAGVRSNVAAIAAFSTPRVSSVGLRSRPSKSARVVEPRPVGMDNRLCDLRPDDETGARGAVIGSARAVRPRGSAELGHHDHRRVRPCVAHVGAERHQPFSELAEQPVERAARETLVRVRVPPAEFDRRDVRSAVLPQNLRGRLHQRRNAASPRAAARHRLLADEILLLHAPLRSGRTALCRCDTASTSRSRYASLTAPSCVGDHVCTSYGPVSERGMPDAIAIPDRWPGITCSSRFNQPSDDPDRLVDAGLENGLAVEVASRAIRNRHRVQRDELVLLPRLAQRREPGRQAERVGQLDEIRFLVRRTRRAATDTTGSPYGHDRGETVESSAQQHEDEPSAMLRLREVDDGKSEGGDAAEAHVSNEGAAIHGHLH